MINFEEEVKKYEFIMTIDEVAGKAMEEKEKEDVIEILELISDKINGRNKG